MDFFEFKRTAERATETGKVLKFPRYTKNLSYNSEGIYSYNEKIANLDLHSRTVQTRGYWSLTTSKHYNYVKIILRDRYGFKEIDSSSSSTEEPEAEEVIQSMSYWDHT